MTAHADPEQTPDLDVLIGERVNAIMWRKKMTQTALAPHLGVAQSVLGRKLHGQVTWSARDLIATAAALDVQVSDLLPPSSHNKNSPTNPGEAVSVTLSLQAKRARRDSNPQPSDP